MNLKEWVTSSKRKGRLSDSSLLSGASIGDSEKSRFVSIWSDAKVLAIWSDNKIKRI